MRHITTSDAMANVLESGLWSPYTWDFIWLAQIWENSKTFSYQYTFFEYFAKQSEWHKLRDLFLFFKIYHFTLQIWVLSFTLVE